MPKKQTRKLISFQPDLWLLTLDFEQGMSTLSFKYKLNRQKKFRTYNTRISEEAMMYVDKKLLARTLWFSFKEALNIKHTPIKRVASGK